MDGSACRRLQINGTIQGSEKMQTLINSYYSTRINVQITVFCGFYLRLCWFLCIYLTHTHIHTPTHTHLCTNTHTRLYNMLDIFTITASQPIMTMSPHILYVGTSSSSCGGGWCGEWGLWWQRYHLYMLVNGLLC